MNKKVINQNTRRARATTILPVSDVNQFSIQYCNFKIIIILCILFHYIKHVNSQGKSVNIADYYRRSCAAHQGWLLKSLNFFSLVGHKTVVKHKFLDAAS